MKAKRVTMLWSLPIVAGTIALSSAYGQQASTTEWNADPGTPGNWNDETWSAGVPIADSLAGIVNGGTVGVTAATATLEQLFLSGGSVLNVNALVGIQGTNGIAAIVDPPTPAVPGTGLIVGSGTLNVNAGGDLQVNTGGDFAIGKGGVATMSLADGGAISTDRLVYLGLNSGSSAAFTQTGGTLTHTVGEFRVGANGGTGSFSLQSGTANVRELKVSHGIGGSTGTINQSGGVLNVSGGNQLSLGWDGDGNATYNLTDGTINTTNRIRMGIGSAVRANLFNQTGGSVYVTGGATASNGRIDIGEVAGSTNTYAISSGSLSTTGRILVGAHTSGTGILDISGDANVNVFGVFVANNATNTGTVSIAGEAVIGIGEFEVRNGSVTQSGESSDLLVTTRLWVGSTQTVSQTATYTLVDGMLKLPADNRIGNASTGNATLNIEGGTLTTTNRLRLGIGKADGTLTPTNLVNQTGGSVSIAGRLDIGEFPGPTNIYQISGGSLTTSSNVLVGYFSDGTGTFTVDGSAEVDVPAVVMGENAGTNVTGTKGTVNLLGGTLTTGQIRVGNGLTADQTLVLDGGTIRARTGGTTLIAGNVTTTSLLSGGITFDTDGLNVSTAAVMTGPGGITKKGLGTLTVNSVQAYTGATRVEEGTLVLAQPYLADNGDVYLTTGAVLELAHAANDTIGTLYIDGQPQPIGTYGGSSTGAGTELDLLMTGAGVLNATTSGTPAVAPVISSITVAGGIATITMTGAPNTNYVCRFSDDLVTPFAPISTTPGTITTNGNGDATFTVDASVSKRFYVVGAAD
jgi:autotransporter-associated beta strand protein